MLWEYASFVLGLLLCIIGIGLIVEVSTLGESTIPAAVATTLVGLSLFGISGARLLKR